MLLLRGEGKAKVLDLERLTRKEYLRARLSFSIPILTNLSVTIAFEDRTAAARGLLRIVLGGSGHPQKY